MLVTMWQQFMNTTHVVSPLLNQDQCQQLVLEGNAWRQSPHQSFVTQQQVNALIKSGQELEDRDLHWIFGDIYLTNLYQLVIELKEDLMESMIVHDSPRCFLPDGTEVVGEGFVFYSESGRSYKLVDRPVFAYNNFTQGKFQ